MTTIIYIGQALPGGQYGPIDRGVANESVVPFTESIPEIAPGPKKTTLSEVNPEPVSVTVVPTSPCCGDIELIRTFEIGVGVAGVDVGLEIGVTGMVEVETGVSS